MKTMIGSLSLVLFAGLMLAGGQMHANGDETSSKKEVKNSKISAVGHSVLAGISGLGSFFTLKKIDVLKGLIASVQASRKTIESSLNGAWDALMNVAKEIDDCESKIWVNKLAIDFYKSMFEHEPKGSKKFEYYKNLFEGASEKRDVLRANLSVLQGEGLNCAEVYDSLVLKERDLNKEYNNLFSKLTLNKCLFVGATLITLYATYKAVRAYQANKKAKNKTIEA